MNDLETTLSPPTTTSPRLVWTCWALLAWGLVAGGCTAVRTVPTDREARAFLSFEVEPARTKLYIDGAYRGRLSKWVDGVVPVAPGTRRVALRADGYLTRRFEVTVEPGERRHLRLEMEPELGWPDAETGVSLRRRLEGARQARACFSSIHSSASSSVTSSGSTSSGTEALVSPSLT